MTLKQLVLRLALVTLGITVLLGAVGVVIGSGRHAAQAIASVITVVLCMSAVVGLSFLLDKHALRAGAIAACGVVVACMLMVLAGTWLEVFFSLGSRGWRWEGTLFSTCACLLGFGLPASGALMLRQVQGLAAGARALCWLLVVGFLACVASLWGEAIAEALGFGRGNWDNLLGSGITVALVGTLVCLSFVGRTAKDRHFWRWLAIPLGAASWLALQMLIWHETRTRQEWVEKLFFGLLILTAVPAHAALLLLPDLPPRQLWLRRASFGLGWAAAAAGLIAIALLNVWRRDWERELLAKFSAATAILCAGASLTVLIMWRLNRKERAVLPTPAEYKSVELVCPGCGRRQTHPAGGSACGGCGLRFTIKIEEPRCSVCGYLLYHLQADRCPECGTPVATGAPAPAVEGELSAPSGPL